MNTISSLILNPAMSFAAKFGVPRKMRARYAKILYGEYQYFPTTTQFSEYRHTL